MRYAAYVCILQYDAKDVLLHEVVVVLDDVLMVNLLQDLDLLVSSVPLSVDHLLDGKALAFLLGLVDFPKVARTKEVLDCVVVVGRHFQSQVTFQ